MKFNRHYGLEGSHAFLSASKPHWLNYDDEQMERRFTTAMASARGTAMHELAHNLIKLRVKLPRTDATLNLYVNDCIGYHMKPEQMLFYSANCYGTADAIVLRRNTLRIFDLKTGRSQTSFEQLKIYAALFCLEYNYDPEEFELIDLRIYQNDQIKVMACEAKDIRWIMERILHSDKLIADLREEIE